MRYFISAFLLLLVFVIACERKESADQLLVNGTIYTLNDAFVKEEAMALKDGEIIALGTSAALKENFKADTMIDLNQKPVYPGFHDAHAHFWGYAENLRKVDLRGTQSFKEILEKLKLHSEKYEGQWILGRGWDQNDWLNQAYPDKSILDNAFPNRPVYLTRVDGHAAIVNSRAIEMAGITTKTEVEGGEFLKHKGELSGILIDNAMAPVRRKIPELNRDVMKELLQQAAENVHAVGLTALSDAGLTRREIALIDSMQQNGSLPLKIDAWLADDSATIEHFTSKGVYKTPYLRVGTIKLFADGALGSRGARLIKEYSDDTGNKGLWVTSAEHLAEVCRIAYENDYQVATHAIGDAANRRMLDIYQEFLSKDNNRRWRIEHAQVVRPADIKRFGEYNIIPSVQTTHATSDMYWAGERLGKERMKTAYAYKELLQQNGWLPNGSDFPVERINPLFGFYAALVRKDQSGWPANGFQKENALTRKEALRAMTIWAAKASFDETNRGSLEKGKAADFVILNSDLMEVPEEKLYSIQVLQTWINGTRVH